MLPITCRAMMRRISASLSWITSPLTSNVTLWIVPVNSKGRLVERRDRRAGVGADGDPPRQPQAERRGVGEIGLTDELAVDVELGAAGSALAVGEVRRASHFEFEAQFVMPGRDRDGAGHMQVVASHVVLNILQLVILHIQ